VHTAPARDIFSARRLVPRVAFLFVVALLGLTGLRTELTAPVSMRSASTLDSGLSAEPHPDQRLLRVEAQFSAVSAARRNALRAAHRTVEDRFQALAADTSSPPLHLGGTTYLLTDVDYTRRLRWIHIGDARAPPTGTAPSGLA